MREFFALLTAVFLLAVNSTVAQVDSTEVLLESDTLVIIDDDPILAMMDSLMTSNLFNHYCYSSDVDLLNVFDFAKDSIPVYTDSIYARRLYLLDRETPMDLGYNSTVKGFIDLYARRRKELSSKVLGLSNLYFPLIEETFDRYGIPLELKYLAIVESALNPTARSRVGATGLWQFMYATGKMYGLQSTSYVDDRMDPYKSTEAAAKYLKYLHGLYDDWNLALAAYNSGPGNVNKAIRRSGGKKDFWSISPYLPRETRGYVPAFIAVNYIMNYATEHNVYPEVCQLSFFDCDTIQISKGLRFDQLSAFTGISVEELSRLNPRYKTGVIPENGKKHTLLLPVDKVGVFLANEDSIYAYKKDEAPKEIIEQEEEKITYRVRSGDVLGTIARKHGVSVNSIKSWNNIRGTTIYPGQKLIIHVNRKNG